jgi:hypothetical protein
MDLFNYANLIDGTLGSQAGYLIELSGSGEWMKIDFGAGNAYDLIEWEIYAYNTTLNGIWSVQYSDDDSAWTTVATGLDAYGTAGWASATW